MLLPVWSGAARVKGRPVHIVVDRQHTMASDLIERLETQSEYKGVFISAEDAMIACDFNTLLIVGGRKPSWLVESAGRCSNLSTRSQSLTITASAADYIENAVVSLHEPYASSASELVSELLQYLGADQRHSHLRGGSHAGGYLSGYQRLFNAHRRPHI